MKAEISAAAAKPIAPSNNSSTRRQRLLPSERAIAEVLGARMRSARTVRGLTRAQLGKLIGRGELTIMYWEKGASSPLATTLHALAAALGVTEAALLGRVSEAEWAAMLDRISQQSPELDARMADRKALGRRIQAARKNQGFTLDDLGERMGTAGSTVSQWEHGARLPAPKTIRRLARILQVTVSDLADGASNTAPPLAPALSLPVSLPAELPVGADLPGDIAGRLRWLRRRRAVSLTTMSQETGISGVTLRRWEQGCSKPCIDHLFEIAAYHGVHPILILTGDHVT